MALAAPADANSCAAEHAVWRSSRDACTNATLSTHSRQHVYKYPSVTPLPVDPTAALSNAQGVEIGGLDDIAGFWLRRAGGAAPALTRRTAALSSGLSNGRAAGNRQTRQVVDSRAVVAAQK